MIEINTEVESQGYIFIRSFYPEESTINIANKIGSPALIDGLSKVERLTPSEKNEAKKNQYSGIFGTAKFPLHTDLSHWAKPPHYLLLRCIAPEENVATTLLTFDNAVEGLHPAELRRALFQPRRPILGKKPLLNFFDGIKFRWDSEFLQPVNNEGKIVRDRMLSCHIFNKEKRIFLTKKFDTLIIDNWKMLHGRTAVQSNSKSRIIERIYLNEI